MVWAIKNLKGSLEIYKTARLDEQLIEKSVEGNCCGVDILGNIMER